MLPLMSVLIFDRGELGQLKQSLEVLSNQTYPNLEVYVVSSSSREDEILDLGDLPFSVTFFSETTKLSLFEELMQGDYFFCMDSRDTLFEPSIEKLYHALSLVESEVVIGNFSEFVNGEFLFYPFGDFILEKVSRNDALLKVDSFYDLDKRIFDNLSGKLFHKKLLPDGGENFLELAAWRLYTETEHIMYLNYPTVVYTPRKGLSLKESYRTLISQQEERLKVAAGMDGFPLEDAKRNYMQRLANFSEWLNNEGATKDAEILHHELVAAENGIFPFLDLEDLDFTIISNNCVGGLIYKQFGLPYRTPFVGLFVLPDDYYKLTKDFAYYMNQELVFDEELHYFSKDNQYYPVGYLDDVALHFLHYHSIEEARDKWNRRKARINWKNIYFKFDNKDGASEDLLIRMDKLPYRNKLILVHREYSSLDNQVIVPNQEHLPELGIIDTPMEAFDVVSWLQQGGNNLEKEND